LREIDFLLKISRYCRFLACPYSGEYVRFYCLRFYNQLNETEQTL